MVIIRSLYEILTTMCVGTSAVTTVTCVDAGCFASTSICDGGSVTACADASGADTDLFFLTDAAGMILSTNSTGTFSEDPLNLTADGVTEYQIYVLNYDSNNLPDPIPVVGENVNTIGSTIMGCYNDDFLLEYLCFTVDALPMEAAPAAQTECMDATPLTLMAPAGYTYEWPDASTLQTFDVTATGNYDVIITNAAGCDQVLTYPVTVNPLPMPTVMVTCGTGEGTGEITVSPSTGLEYSTDGGLNYQASNVFSGLANGDYIRLRYET